MIYGFSRTNWWLVVTDSLVFIDLCFVFWLMLPDLLCEQRSGKCIQEQVSGFALGHTVGELMNI